jgi:hypothetical protein
MQVLQRGVGSRFETGILASRFKTRCLFFVYGGGMKVNWFGRSVKIYLSQSACLEIVPPRDFTLELAQQLTLS